MPKRLLGFDPLTGLKTYHSYENGMTTISYEHDDVEPVLDSNREIQTRDLSTYKRKRDVWHAATIPESIILKWRLEDGLDIFNPDHFGHLARKLNDPDWRYLRTWTGKIGVK